MHRGRCQRSRAASETIKGLKWCANMDSIGGKAVLSFNLALKGVVLGLALCASTRAWADFTMTNPVTGEPESYTWKYVGTDGVWNSKGNWEDSAGSNPTGDKGVGIHGGSYDPFYFDNAGVVTAPGTNKDADVVEGWNLRIGVYNGTTARIARLQKIAGGQQRWISVDSTSKLTIGRGDGQFTNAANVNYYVAAAEGIVFTNDFSSLGGGTAFNIYYNLAGAGSVVYQNLGVCSHYIKRADVTLSHAGPKERKSKTLVSFTRSTQRFQTSDTMIYVIDGSVTNTVSLAGVANIPDSVTITTADRVGTCQLVQESTGVKLYYIDGPVEEDVTITSPFDGASLASPSFAAIYSTSTTSISFGEETLNASTYQQMVGGRTAVVAKVTGGEYTDINGFMRQGQTTSNTNKDVYVVVSGATAKRINGVQEAHWSGNTRRTRTEGNSIVQVEDGTTVAYVMGAGYKGGRMPATVDGSGDSGANAQVQGNTGVTVKGGTVTGTVVGGWTAAHQGTPTVTGNTAVRIETVLGTATAVADDKTLVGGYVVGGSMYQANSGTGTSVGGNSSVTLALGGKSGNFDRIVVGGSLRRGTEDSTSGTQAVAGNSSVSIVASDDVRFQSTATIIGGGALLTSSGSGSVTVGGNASVSINGGTYLGTIVAGGYSPEGGTASVAGTATLTLNGGVFTGATLMGGNANGNKTLTLGENVDASDVASVVGFNVVNVGSGSSLKMSAIPATATIASGATMEIINDEASLEIGCGWTNNGTLDLSGCGSLTTLTAPMSMLGNIALPESIETVIAVPDDESVRDLSAYAKPVGFGNGIVYRIRLAETKAEYGAGSIEVDNVASGVCVRIVRPDGSMIDEEPAEGRVVLNEAVRIDGAATAHDVTFTNTTAMAYTRSGAYMSTSSGHYNNNNADKTTGIMLYDTPYIKDSSWTLNDLDAFQSSMTLAIVGQMPTAKPTCATLFVHLGGSNGADGFLIAAGKTTDEVIVAYNKRSVVTKLSTIKVPNAATTRHVYVITKEDEGSATTFTIYLDGIKWETVVLDFLHTISGGVQIGADFGNQIRGKTQGDGLVYNAVTSSDSPSGGQVTDTTGYVNLIRLYDRILTQKEIDQYSMASEYQYVSPNGSSSRTLTRPYESWVQDGETDWSNTTAAGEVTLASAPSAGSSLSVNASVSSTVTINVEEDTSYEALTVNGEAIHFVAGPSGGEANITGVTTIGAETTIDAGAVDISGAPVIITEAGSIEFDYSSFDITSLVNCPAVITLTGQTDQKDDKVSIVAPSGTQSVFALNYNGTLRKYQLTITPAVSVTQNDVTTYYSTLAEAMVAAGSNPATISLHVDMSNNVSLAFGQRLITGETDYTGTPTSSDPAARVIEEEGAFRVVYGTIFSVY